MRKKESERKRKRNRGEKDRYRFEDRKIREKQKESKTGIVISNMNPIRVDLSLPPTRQDLTQGQKPEGQLKWG